VIRISHGTEAYIKHSDNSISIIIYHHLIIWLPKHTRIINRITIQAPCKMCGDGEATTDPIITCTFMSNNSQLATLNNKTTLTALRKLLGLAHCSSQFNSKVCRVFVKTNSHSAHQKYPGFYLIVKNFTSNLHKLPKIYQKDLTTTLYTA
jgi:hypothetical protein